MNTERFSRKLLFGLAALACATLCACVTQDEYAPTNQTFIVHALLDANVDDQYVILQKTNGLANQQFAVQGATVTITTPNGRVLTAIETRDTQRFIATVGPKVTVVYRISLSELGETLQFGGRYTLRIQVPGSPDITGVTTIPDASGAATTLPATDTLRRTTDTLKLSWKRTPMTARYQVSVMSAERTWAFMADTAIAIPLDTAVATAEYSARTALFVEGHTYNATVLAIDDNYFRYYKPTADVITESASAQLQNAVGVFGSVARVANRRIFVR